MITILEPKSYPVSAYLSPRAYVILKDFHEGSLYGSMSRTIEEIILAFADIYNIAAVLEQADIKGEKLTPEAIEWTLGQIKRIATGRLNRKTLTERK